MRERLWLGVIPLLLLACWLGARGLDADPIWIDEFFSIYDSGGAAYGPKSPAAIWTGLAERNPWHAPGYFFTLSVWGGLVGWQPPALRALALLLGLLTIAATYRLGRDWLGGVVGLGAAAALAGLSFYIYYLHELRMYTLLALLTVVVVWWYLRLIQPRRSPRWREYAALALLTAALGYSHYLTLLTPAALALWHLLFVPKNRRWWGAAAAFATAAVLYLPWAAVMVSGVELAQGAETLRSRALNIDAAALRLATLLGNGWLPLALLLLGAAGLPLLRPTIMPLAANTRRQLVALWFIALACIGALLLLNAALRIMHVGRLRYFYHFLPLLALLIGAGFASIGGSFAHWRAAPRRRWLSAALALWLVVGVGTVLFNGDLLRGLDGWGYRYPLHQITRALQQRIQPGDFVVNILPDDLYAWMYYERNAQFYLNQLPLRYATLGRETDLERQPEQQPAVRRLIDGERVWLVYLDAPEPAAHAEFSARLEPDYARCGAAALPGALRFELWTRSPVCCSPETRAAPPLLRYGDLALTGVEAARLADGNLDVLIGWAGGSSLPPHEYSTALHLLDAGGELVAQSDGGVPVEQFLCRREVLPTAELPAGDYQLTVIVYNWQTGARLSGELVADGASGERLPVANITLP